MVRNSARLARWLSVAMLMGLSAVCAAQQAGARRKVIIDQDAFGPAGSNLQAILMLLQAGDVDVLGITVPSGDGWRDEEVSHALRLLEVAGRTDVHVYPGAVYPLVNSPLRTKRWEQLYGTLFYKGAWTETWPAEGTVRRTPYHADPFLVPASPAGMPSARPAAESAVDFLVRSVREYPGQVTILAAGPLTDIALAARLDPQFATLAKELVFMGGSFSPVAADNAFANEYINAPRLEFNMRWDPEAASIVLHEPWKKITQIPIDPTTRTLFKPEYFQQLRAGHAPFDAYLVEFGQPYPMWDELAVAVWLDPSIVTRSSSLLVDVDTSFTAGYGNTLSWTPGSGPGLGERAVLVVQDVDVPRFEGLALDLLSRAPPRR
jgi:inosine-uridine nucleoside N-ribohydrolase